jgi:glycerol kinase
MAQLVAAIDQGTTSTRCIVFGRRGEIVARAQKEHRQIYPQPGWVEHDALEIWRSTEEVIGAALAAAPKGPATLAAVGITNQRETSVLWHRATGAPLAPAITWQDTRVADRVTAYTRAAGQDRFRALTGLPLATYFSALKLQWLLEHVPDARRAAESGDALFGTIDSWLLWNLTGGPKGGLHLTDVTNASRTQLMGLATLDWEPQLLSEFGIPRACLPRITASSQIYGDARATALAGTPVAGMLGDQQAALVGQAALLPGEAKNTYGTGCFVLVNTGVTPVVSKAGLITTLAYQLGGQPPCYALEGSIAITGALVQWLRDGLGLIRSSAEIEPLARQVADNGDVYFVPAFSGLFAPHWKAGARGVITGLTAYANRGHLARAALEATAYQTRDVLAAMAQDCGGTALRELRVDGGMAVNDLLMQFQADILDVPVVRPRVTETTALGAAYAAGLAVGYWKDPDDLRQNWQVDRRWTPQMSAAERERLYNSWQKALARSLDWAN